MSEPDIVASNTLDATFGASGAIWTFIVTCMMLELAVVARRVVRPTFLVAETAVLAEVSFQIEFTCWAYKLA